ncbi:MAG: hypothetical protein IKR57_00135 [Bacilli bacterium]|nr:hypothetical protein [Bacilli bacterium]
MKDYFNYRYEDLIDFSLKESSHLSVIGNSNDFFIESLLEKKDNFNIFIGDKELLKDNISTIRKRMSIVLNKHLNIFVGETVKDEIAFGLESLAKSKTEIRNLIDSESKRFKIDNILENDPNSLGISDKVKMKILSSMIINPKIIVLDDVICELDYNDKLLIFNILDEFKKNGGIIINVTNDIEETLESDRIIIIQDKKLICDGKSLSVLNEEKLLKRLGLGIPFIVELNKYFMDYGMIDKYYLTNEKLVGALWK